MVALFHRERTGEGQYLDLALVDCLLAAQAPLVSYYFATGKQPPKLGNRSLFTAPTNAFQTADRPINLCILNDKHWAKLCQVIGREDLIEDHRFKTTRLRVENPREINGAVAQVLKERPAGRLAGAHARGRCSMRARIHLRRNFQRSADPATTKCSRIFPIQRWVCKRPLVCRFAFTRRRAKFAGRRRCWGSTAGKYWRPLDTITRKLIPYSKRHRCATLKGLEIPPAPFSPVQTPSSKGPVDFEPELVLTKEGDQ